MYFCSTKSAHIGRSRCLHYKKDDWECNDYHCIPFIYIQALPFGCSFLSAAYAMALLLCVWWLFLWLGRRFESTRLSSSFGWLHFGGGRSRLISSSRDTAEAITRDVLFALCALWEGITHGLRVGFCSKHGFYYRPLIRSRWDGIGILPLVIRISFRFPLFS